MFDPRLSKVVIAIVDVAYGGENGFNQAIELAADSLTNVRFVAEKKLLGKMFEEIDKDTGKYCYGIRDTMTALAQGAMETLLVWEDLDVDRLVLRNNETQTTEVQFLKPDQRPEGGRFKDKVTGVELELVEEAPFTEWLAENYKDFGCRLEFVTDKSEEGSQFCRGFGGVGGLLRYKLEFYDVYGDGGDADSSSDSEFI